MKGIKLDKIDDVRGVSVFNSLMNERNIEFKKAQIIAHSAVNPTAENINALLAELHALLYPWKKITSEDNNQNLIDLFRENY